MRSAKITVIHRFCHAPEVLGASPDDQFVDQRVAHALYLSQGWVCGTDSGFELIAACTLEVVAQTPMVPFGSLAEWMASSEVKSVIGTSIAMVLTLNPATESGAS